MHAFTRRGLPQGHVYVMKLSPHGNLKHSISSKDSFKEKPPPFFRGLALWSLKQLD